MPSMPIPELVPDTSVLVGVGKDRYSDLQLKDLINIRQKDLDITNVTIQKLLCYPKPNVIAMIRKGHMQLPDAKCVEMADLLKVDRTFFLGKVISEKRPALWDAICTVMGDRLVTANELALIKFVREGLDGHDTDLMGTYDFGKTIAPVLADAFKRESALAHAALDRTDA
jgi:hypothetical protein